MVRKTLLEMQRKISTEKLLMEEFHRLLEVPDQCEGIGTKQWKIDIWGARISKVIITSQKKQTYRV